LLRAARRAADSAISATRQPGHDATEVLALFAALSGHCSAAAEFAREGTLNRGDIPGVAQQVYEGAAQRLALVALGCGIPAGVPSLEDLSTAAMLDQAPPATRLSAWSRLFGREVRTSDSLDVTWAVRLAPAGDFLITARLDAERGRPDSARARLLPLEMRRRDMLRGTVTPDAVVPEARLWLTLGDTTHAARWLDDVLRNARFISLQFNTEVDNLVLVASTVRAMALRAQISRDPADARRWARAVLALWDGSDAPLQPTIRALRRLAQ
jgi:hypothetical protein